MKLHVNTTGREPLFVAESSFEERGAPKAAGFLWHGGGRCRPSCGACAAGLGKVWWTKFPEAAARLIEYATPEARTALGGHVEAVEASKATDANIDVPAPDGLDYLPYQRGGIAYAMKRESTLIGDEMGLGKTIQAIGVMNADPTVMSVLVICPASLRLNWKREIEKWMVRPVEVRVVDDEHPVPDVTPPADGALLVVVANYDRVRREDVHPVLMGRDWDLLIVDEAHRVKNPKTKQAKAILGYVEKVDNVVDLNPGHYLNKKDGEFK